MEADAKKERLLRELIWGCCSSNDIAATSSPATRYQSQKKSAKILLWFNFFLNQSFARRVYGHSVFSTLSCGTTTANYFATIHREASMELCRSAEERGQRALVGKVCMDRNELMPR